MVEPDVIITFVPAATEEAPKKDRDEWLIATVAMYIWGTCMSYIVAETILAIDANAVAHVLVGTIIAGLTLRYMVRDNAG